jgi:transposase
MGEAMGRAISIRDDRSPVELRLLARRERDGRVAARLYAIANALEGMTRAEAARLAGMERQALRDAVVRYNAEGLAGLKHRPKGHPPQKLSEAEEAVFAAVIFRGPDPQTDGVSAWTRPDLCRWLAAHFGKTYHPSSLTRVLRRMGLSRQKVRPVHPQSDARAQERFKKRGSATR